MRRHATTAALALLALLALAPAASAVRPPAGTKFVGKTSQGRTINLRVSASGGLVMTYRERFRCKGIRDQTLVATYRKDRPTVAADGTYKYRKRYSGVSSRGLPSPFTNTQRLSGRFSADGSSVSGRSFARVFGKGFSCRSSITYTARRRP